jgi:hypothetical protein
MKHEPPTTVLISLFVYLLVILQHDMSIVRYDFLSNNNKVLKQNWTVMSWKAVSVSQA